MKKSLFLFLAAIAFFACQTEQTPKPLLFFENDLLEVTITENHSEEELMGLKKHLLDTHGIILDFEELIYNKNGKIEKIAIAVDSQDGFSGTASSKCIFGIAPYVNFYRDFNEGTGSPFGIGTGDR